MLRRPAPSLRFVLLAPVVLGACATVIQRPPEGQAAAPATLREGTITSEAHALHLLNRLTFGPRPGDVARVASIGPDRWIEQQLDADTALDNASLAALAGCNVWTEPIAIAESRLSGMESFPNMGMSPTGLGSTSRISILVPGFFGGLVTRDSALRAGAIGGLLLANGQLIACKLARVEASENQLLEVMTDFWHNHFSFFASKTATRGALLAFDRTTVRPRALGRFRDLLGAVAHSPAMLEYLDNAVSRRTGLNENYARELLELHTLGVDGGYSQKDVIEVARAFTGWSHSRSPIEPTSPGSLRLLGVGSPVSFRFDSAAHDTGPKVVLGRVLPADRGQQDGEDVLDIVARHPSTARFIARKLAVRFVSDTPPQSLVDRAAQAFSATDGDIRSVVRTIVTSPEFESRDAFGAKVKSPLEFVLSLRRLFAAPVDTLAEEIDLLVRLEQPPYGRPSPDGWPETGSAWLNVGSMMTRLAIISALTNGELASIPVEKWSEWKSLSTAAFDVQVGGVIASLLNGQVSPNTRAVLASARPKAGVRDDAAVRTEILRELIVLALSSPEFQHR